MSYLEHKKYKLFDGWSCVATSFIDFVNQLRQSNPTEKNLTNEEIDVIGGILKSDNDLMKFFGYQII